MSKYVAIAYHGDGLTILEHEQLMGVLLELLEVLNAGQDGWTIGFAKDGYEAARDSLLENELNSYEEIMDMLSEHLESVPEMAIKCDRFNMSEA